MKVGFIRRRRRAFVRLWKVFSTEILKIRVLLIGILNSIQPNKFYGISGIIRYLH